MDMESIDAEDLYGELNAHQRRRLYFLFLALGKSEPETAIEIAERMERFVTSKKIASTGVSADASTDEVDAEAGDLPEDSSDGDDLVVRDVRAAAATVERLSTAFARVANAGGSVLRPPAAVARPSGAACVTPIGIKPDMAPRRSALDGAQRHEFKLAIAAGASNDELATRFGLTRRQAHGLRIGFARAKGGGSSCRREEQKPHYNAAAEREQQDSFLSRRPAPSPTMEDVVRFLRQIGDVVVRNGDHYLVNYSLSLTQEEMVVRANRKRAANGKTPFSLDGASSASAPPTSLPGAPAATPAVAHHA
jgi:hypothetical protein